MKTSLNIKEPTTLPLTFPVLASHKTGDQKVVVLFSTETDGVVVYAAVNAPYKVGHHSYNWTRITYETTWTILPQDSSVVLTQNFQN